MPKIIHFFNFVSSLGGKVRMKTAKFDSLDRGIEYSQSVNFP